MDDSKRSRMFDGEEPQNPSPRTTIVGGRPPDRHTALPPVPTGLQQLLRLAAVDDAFKGELVTRRSALAETAGIPLTAHERAILEAVPAEQLVGMAGNLPPPDADRREFLRQTARTAVVALGGAVLASGALACPVTRGISPDVPPERPDTVAPPTGINPDLPPDRPEVPEMQTTGGAAPDEPPPRPESPEMMTEGGAAPDEPPPRPGESEPVFSAGVSPDPPPQRPGQRPSDAKGGVVADEPPPRPARNRTQRLGGINPDLTKKRTKLK